MGFFELFLIAVGLSMDAFAVALIRGLRMPKFSYSQAGIIALFFGGFQALMPLIGWLLGSRFEVYIQHIDHWIAFGILAFIGIRMIYQALKEKECPAQAANTLHIKELVLMATATSIDALAIGLTFAFLGIAILPAVSLIGIIAFILSFAGVALGYCCGIRFKRKAELTGGMVLIFIGLKILLEHLGIS